jgi:hypothetical protein
MPNPKNTCTVNKSRARPVPKVEGGEVVYSRKGVCARGRACFRRGLRSVTYGLAVKSATPGDGPNRKGRYGTGKADGSYKLRRPQLLS